MGGVNEHPISMGGTMAMALEMPSMPCNVLRVWIFLFPPISSLHIRCISMSKHNEKKSFSTQLLAFNTCGGSGDVVGHESAP